MGIKKEQDQKSQMSKTDNPNKAILSAPRNSYGNTFYDTRANLDILH